MKIIRIGLMTAPLIFIFLQVRPQKLFETIHHIAWWTIPALVVITLASMTIQGTRWWMLIRAFVPDVTFFHAISCHFASLYYSLVLPTSGAQDIVRALLLSRKVDYSVTWASTVVARILSAVTFAVLSLYGLIRIVGNRIPNMPYYAAGAFLLIMLVVFLLFSKRVTRPIRTLIAHRIPPGILAVIDKIRQGVYLYRSKKAVIVKVFLVSLVLQLLFAFNGSCLIGGITGRFHFLECLAFLPLIEFVCLVVPLTPGGTGIREALIALMFKSFGVSNEQIGMFVALSLLSSVMKLVGIAFTPFVGKKPVLPGGNHS